MEGRIQPVDATVRLNISAGEQSPLGAGNSRAAHGHELAAPNHPY